MSMIGLLTGAPQAAGSKAQADDTGAAGFGTALQGELAALAEAGVHGSPTVSVLPSVEPVETATDNELPTSAAPALRLPASTIPTLGQVENAADRLPDPVGPAIKADSATTMPGSVVPLGESVPTRSVPHEVPASAGRALGSEAPTGTSSPASSLRADPAPVSAGSTAETAPASTPTPSIDVVGKPAGSPSPAGAASGTATLPAISPTPQSAPVPTPPVPDDVPASAGRAIGSVTATGTSAQAPVATGRSTAAAASRGAAAETSVATASSSSTASAQPSASTAMATPATPVAAPVSAPVQASTPVASVAPPAPAATVPFTAQLARPIFSLAAAGAGEHILTVSVTPDNLGPVTVRAHVGAEGVRVELFAPNDLGRDAIRAIIPDLRRDLAGAGLGSNLSLSSQNQPAADGSGHGSHAGQPGERSTERGNSGDRSVAGENPDAAEQAVDRTGRFGTTSTIDVLA